MIGSLTKVRVEAGMKLWLSWACSQGLVVLLHVWRKQRFAPPTSHPKPLTKPLSLGAGFGQVPSLDHANPELREGLKQWLKHLQENVGFCGWRLGYAKG